MYSDDIVYLLMDIAAEKNYNFIRYLAFEHIFIFYDINFFDIVTCSDLKLGIWSKGYIWNCLLGYSIPV